MSQQQPPAPQMSPDGRFYYDGTTWQPMPGQPPPAAPAAPAPVAGAPAGHLGRNVLIIVGIVVAIVILVAIANAGKKPAVKPVLDVQGRASTQGGVGVPDGLQVTIVNKGPAIGSLVIYLNANDDWLKHHVVTDPGGCTINSSLGRLDCGALATGETKTVAVTSSPKDAGNFSFELDVASADNDQLAYPDGGALIWSEAVTP